MWELIRILVEFTPTEKDDELLDKIETFMIDNPKAVELLFALIRSKL